MSACEMAAPKWKDARDQMERAVVGLMLHNMPGDVSRLLEREDFRSHAHQTVYSACVDVFLSGRACDVVAAHDRLLGQGKLDEVGGAYYLAELYEGAGTPSSLDYYCQRIREHSVLDAMQLVLTEHAALAKQRNGKAEDVIAAAEQAVFAVANRTRPRESRPLPTVIADVLDAIDRRSRGELRGLPTGLKDVDLVLTGLQPGQLIVIASRPAVGKTAVACNLARNAVLSGCAVRLVSLEMSAEELTERLLVIESGVDAQDVRQGAINPADARRLQKARDVMVGWPLMIDDSPVQKVARIAGTARRDAARGLGLVIIDYLQLVEPDSRKVARQEQVATISRSLKQLARELQVPVVALAQLNRETEGRAGQKPRLSDLRESGAIEQDSDVVILLHKDLSRPGQLDMLVVKQRNGPIGEVPVRYEPQFYRIGDL